MEKIEQKLNELKDENYAVFQAKLCPTVKRENILGVRVPILRNYAKELILSPYVKDFFNELPHKYYDETLLHGLTVSLIKDYDVAVYETERLLPFVDNWAVCDTLCPKVFKKNTDKLIEKIKVWLKSDKTYTVRFGIEMLMNFYLDEKFDRKYIELVTNVKSEEYYVNMMIAWFLATSLTKQWKDTIGFIEKQNLSPFVQNKSIQKAIESFRITDEQKKYLRNFKV